jgi:hypothetical protein
MMTPEQWTALGQVASYAEKMHVAKKMTPEMYNKLLEKAKSIVGSDPQNTQFLECIVNFNPEPQEQAQ